MRYSRRFERDYDFYIKNLNRFSFCGKSDHDFMDKKGNSMVVNDDNGVSAKEAFYNYESQGKISKTSDPKLLLSLHKCKSSINLHISLWAEGRRDGTFPKIEWDQYAKEVGLLTCICKAVEKNTWIYRSNVNK